MKSNTSGKDNVAFGMATMGGNTTGNYNVAIGDSANYYNETGSYNTLIGYQSGFGNSAHNKSGNVFIGYKAGYNETGSNKLYIENSDSNTPLIGGDFSSDEIYLNGKVGIGTTTPAVKLHVNGGTDASLSSGSGYLVIGNESGANIVFDNNEIISRNNGSASNLYINNTGGNVAIGNVTTPTALLHLYNTTGYNQLRLQKSYTPTGTADSHGSTGDIVWDNDYIYVKTSTGWKRAALSTW